MFACEIEITRQQQSWYTRRLRGGEKTPIDRSYGAKKRTLSQLVTRGCVMKFKTFSYAKQNRSIRARARAVATRRETTKITSRENSNRRVLETNRRRTCFSTDLQSHVVNGNRRKYRACRRHGFNPLLEQYAVTDGYEHVSKFSGKRFYSYEVLLMYKLGRLPV